MVACPENQLAEPTKKEHRSKAMCIVEYKSVAL